ncbi:SDR family oxidoreductase [Phytohalomonas tamaricis]|uniref:SDR family oxidoreductase n=1 Tax=Phytohalomonas tamaricis TaxID=2081032 RepID=UPI000D0BE796|nr:SDR family oxidoreductase [Phytohalomonas tamaricis]
MTSPILLITGASSGIGRATAELAAEQGYHVALAARSADKLEALAQELTERHGTKAIAVSCDVQDWGSQQAMVKQVLDEFGRLDAVFANAGRGLDGKGFAGSDPDEWREVVLTNVLGPALTLRASLEALKSSRGHVLITGSVAGRRTLPGSFYGATKSAVQSMAYNLREEVRGSGIRVTLVEPGLVDTPFFDSPRENALKAEDIARAVVFALNQPASVEVHDMCVLPTPPIDD